ncbi:MAG: ATP-grasp domain-containing protein [Ignavibacteriales bacterium]|nr:ATP-grasp domain-containing protein [Ignavibacteriales bacterium]
MKQSIPLTFLCLASYKKGEDFLIKCKELGNRVLLVTSESLMHENWPKEYIDEIFYVPDNNNEWNMDEVINSISFLARTEKIDRIIAIDDFDVEKAAKLREHLRIGGMGETTARYFRDKLAMRKKAKDDKISIPDFVHVLNHAEINIILDSHKPPYILKPRSQAGAIGIKKLHSKEEAWEAINRLGDQQSYYLIEQFIEGEIFHVDSIIFNYEVKLALAHQYTLPPFEVAHQGRVFCSRSVKKGSDDEKNLININNAVIKSLGLKKGVSHTEFIKGKDGKFYFLETSSRVGGANLSNMIEEYSGVNLWKEWAIIENMKENEKYKVPKIKNNYGAILISLAKQENPDTSNYNDKEITWRLNKKYHAGLVIVSKKYDRISELITDYTQRIYDDFFISQPLKDKATN